MMMQKTEASQKAQSETSNLRLKDKVDDIFFFETESLDVKESDLREAKRIVSEVTEEDFENLVADIASSRITHMRRQTIIRVYNKEE